MPRTSTVTLCLLMLSLAACSAGRADEAARIVEVLAIEPGMTVADVGAGDGEWALELADAVGIDGTVLATEVDEELVEALDELGLDRFRANVRAVLGNDRTTGLPDRCCDAVLLRMVYHHFTDPEAMRESLLAALRPGARIAVIDIVPQTHWGELEGVPDRGGHGIPADLLIKEMTAAGFEVVSRHDDWRQGDEDRYCVVFRRPSG